MTMDTISRRQQTKLEPNAQPVMVLRIGTEAYHTTSHPATTAKVNREMVGIAALTYIEELSTGSVLTLNYLRDSQRSTKSLNEHSLSLHEIPEFSIPMTM